MLASSAAMVDPKMPSEPPEQKARRVIDAQLAASGWVVQHKSDVNLAAGPGVAVRELLTGAGPADYALFLGTQLVGVLEAKRLGTTLSDVEPQTRDYAARAPKHLQVPIRPLPFLYESTRLKDDSLLDADELPDPSPRVRRRPEKPARIARGNPCRPRPETQSHRGRGPGSDREMPNEGAPPARTGNYR